MVARPIRAHSGGHNSRCPDGPECLVDGYALRDCSLLAAEHARRRKSDRGPMPDSPGCGYLHVILRAGTCIAGDSIAPHPCLVPESSAPVLSIPASCDAGGVGILLFTRV